MIKANLDETVMIKEIDVNCIHVRLSRITVTPGRERYPSTSTQIKCFTVKTFEAMEAMRYAKSPTIWYRAGGFDEATVVHDGRLEPKPEVVVMTEEEKLAKKAKDAEMRKIQRNANLAAARAAKQANKT
jgi:hypothetical protein